MQHILVCDDEKDIVAALKIYLESDGYCVHTACSGEEALRVAKTEPVQLALMDIMMPGMDGIAATAELRKLSNVPIIFLTAKSEDTDKILGLNMGADDYITKPFDSKEMAARVKAVLRRTMGQTEEEEEKADDTLSFPGLTVSLSRYEVFYEGKKLEMPPKELELLYFLASSPNHVFTREQLLDQIWGYEYIGETRTVDVHIKRIREKLTENPAWSLTTVWGIGYKFEVNA